MHVCAESAGRWALMQGCGTLHLMPGVGALISLQAVRVSGSEASQRQLCLSVSTSGNSHGGCWGHTLSGSSCRSTSWQSLRWAPFKRSILDLDSRPVFCPTSFLLQVCLAAETCGHVDFNTRGDVWYSSEPFHCGDIPPGHVTYWQIFQKVWALALPCTVGSSECQQQQQALQMHDLAAPE